MNYLSLSIVLGYFVFDLLVLKTVHFVTIIMVIVIGLILFFENLQFFEFTKEKTNFQEKWFEDIRYKIFSDYDWSNPITQKQAFTWWFADI